jgi:cysteine desulfurase NifS
LRGTEAPLELKKGLCGVCPAGCWVEVGLRDGRIVDIEPDAGHTLGTICRRGRHAPEIIYSEHRLLHPMKRVGPKGTFEFEQITWDEAYETVVKNLERIKVESGPEAVSIYTGRGAQEQSLCDMFQPKGVAVSSASNVLFPFGSPNTMGVGALCYVSLHMIAPHVTMGRMQTDMFTDIDNAEMVLVWGTNPSTDSPPVDMERLEAAAARGADIVVIDPRRTDTVSRCNAEWVPVRPGTDGALALSMLEVIISEELYDEDFVENWCHGFDEFCTYVQHFNPEQAERITRVPADTIRDLARRIANANGAALLMYTGLEYSNTGVQSARAVFTLMALSGQLDTPGGIGLSMLGSQFPINRSCNQPNPDLDLAVARREFPVYSDYRGESHAIGLVNSVLNDDPYRIRALLIHGSSLLTSWPQTALWRDTLAGLDFVVCIDRQLTADAAYADIIMPATTMFENYSYMVYGPVFRLRERLIEPVGEARNDYLIMAELASRLGYGEIFPQSEDDLVRFALEGSGFSLEDVRAAGGWVRIPTPMIEYKKWQKGHLRADGQPGFETPTGKFEISSTILEDYGYEPLPKYVEPTEGPLSDPAAAEKYPLVFNSGARPMIDFRSQHHGIEGLVKEYPEPTIDLNAEDASERGIEDGDLALVSTARGAVTFRARVNGDIIRGAVECVMGGGTPVGPKAWQEWNVNELTDLSNLDRISGFPVYKALLCEVSKVEEGTERVKPAAPAKTASFEPKVSPGGNGSGPAVRVYMDNNATTRVADEVREAMLPFLEAEHGNPSSIHAAGKAAREAVEKARRQVASSLNTRPRRILFTGGGSEADNLALKGIAYRYREKGDRIITTSVEHPAILNACRFLERNDFEVTYLPVDENGWLDPGVLRDALDDRTVLVSVMMANNEVGTIMPIKELCAVAHEQGVLFHTDAVQALGKIEVDVEDLGVDLLSISGHKLHGPKGIGALYCIKGVELEPLIHGGSQERGLRAGTENVPAIVGMGRAAEMAMTEKDTAPRIEALRDELEAGIMVLVPGARLNGPREGRLPNTLDLTLPGIRGESVVIAMDQHGIALSSGSACKSGSPEPTHVLIAMGRTPEEAHCSVRFSLSRYTTSDDIGVTLDALSQVLEEKNAVKLMPCK